MKNLFNVKIFIFFIIIFIYTIIYVITTQDKDEHIKSTLNNQIENLNNNYKVTTNTIRLISDNFYETVLNTPKTKELLYKAKHSKTEYERTALREKLYTQMRPHLNHLNKSGVNIILFSFENNRTFLRVHKPDKYNDDLSEVRYSFTYVNDNKKTIRGFEQGKISHAFRNIFPLFYNEEYVGSVDISFSSEVFQDNMSMLHGLDTHFILSKDLFKANIWEAQKKVKYIQSIEHKDFLFALTPFKPDGAFAKDKLALNADLKDEISKNIKDDGPFALYSTSNGIRIIAFSPVKNIKDEKTVAYLVSYSRSHYLEDILDQYLLLNILSLAGLIILALLLYNNLKYRLELETRISKEVVKNEKQKQTLFEQSRLAQMGEMISMIAHQWRQPLGAISTVSIDMRIKSELGYFNLPEEDVVQKYEEYVNSGLKKIDEYVKNLTTTIDDFRNFYKPNKESKLMKLEDIVKSSLDITRASLVSDHINIIEEYNAEEEIELYSNEVMQVILNILKNAQDHFAENKTENPYIKIKTQDKSIYICDNGGGIPDVIIDKIFDPYFSTKDSKNGTGLGLYMSKTIIEEHHSGKLIARNTDDGVCFMIELGPCN